MKANHSFWMLLLIGVAAVKLPAQTLQTLVSFNFTNGAYPMRLTQGNDGNFYGTTGTGGMTNSIYSEGMGTMFRVTTNGILTTLVYFAGTNGAFPVGLVQRNDGSFNGTTLGGGITNLNYRLGMGTVFKVTANGTLTTLVYFADTNGANPDAALTLGPDGDFYGTTGDTAFKMTTNGV